MNKKCDGLIVIGTALQTAFAKQMISSMILKDTVPVVEINLEQNIKSGFCISLLEKSEIALPALF